MFLAQSEIQNIKLGPFLDPSDDVTEETGLAVAVDLSKNGSAFAARNSATAITHDADGWYTIELDATDTSSLGNLVVKSHDSANHKPVSASYYILPSDLHAFFQSSPIDAIKSNLVLLNSSQEDRTRLQFFARATTLYSVDDTSFTPTATQFEIATGISGDPLPATANQLVGQEVRMTSPGRNEGLGFAITAYDELNNRITISPAAPEPMLNLDTIVITRLAATNSSGVRSAVDDSVRNFGLDHLVAVSVLGGDVANNSIIARLASKAPAADWNTYDHATDSQEALSDSATPTIIWAPLIPRSIGLGDDISIGVEVSDADGARPKIADISPGTIRIQRRAVGDIGYTETVPATPLSVIQDGLATYPETFAPGYSEGDTIEITLAGQAVIISGVPHELTSSGGNKYYTEIRHTVPQKMKDLYGESVFIRATVDTVANDGDFTIVADSGYVLSASTGTYDGIWLAFSAGLNDGVSRFVSTYTGSTRRCQFIGTDGPRDAPFPNTVGAGDQCFLLGHR